MTETLVINEEEQGKTLEESAAEMGLLEEEGPVNQDPTPSRPEWLPDKFESVEDMAKAYGELEDRLSRSESQQTASEETPEETTGEKEAREATAAAGVDYDALSREYYDNGGLSEDNYEALSAAGIPRHIVDQFIAGQEASAEVQRSAILGEVGGEDKYTEMREWAAGNFNDEEIAAFDETVTTGSAAAIRMAVAGLKARFEADQSNEPLRMVSGDVANGSNVYRSNAELMEDMNNPRYHSDPAFRADVIAKLGRSDIM